MKMTFTLDPHCSSSRKKNALMRVQHELGSRASISGEHITVEDAVDENKVVGILSRDYVTYVRSAG